MSFSISKKPDEVSFESLIHELTNANVKLNSLVQSTDTFKKFKYFLFLSHLW